MSRPLVTVIIPCYNTERFVRETLLSVTRQSYPNLEIIVVNDGSADNSAEVIQSVADARIVYIYQENQGLSAARNTGMRAAKGKYVMFLDADDLIFPEKIALQTKWLEKHPEYDILACGFDRTDERGEKLYSVNPAQKEIRTTDLLTESQFPVHTALCRRSIIEKTGFFDTELKAAEDWDYWCRTSLAGARIYRWSRSLCTYRLLDTAMTGNAPRQTEMLLRVVDKNFKNYSLPQDLRILETKAREKVLLTGTARCLVLDFAAEGVRYLQMSVRTNSAVADNNFSDLAGKIAGMLVHMNAHADLTQRLTAVQQTLEKEFAIEKDFTAAVIFRYYWLTGRKSAFSLLTNPQNTRFLLQMLRKKLFRN